MPNMGGEGRGKACWREHLQPQLAHLKDEKTKVTAQMTLVTSIFQQWSCCISDNDRGKNSPWLEPGRRQWSDGSLKLKTHKPVRVLWRDRGGLPEEAALDFPGKARMKDISER